MCVLHPSVLLLSQIAGSCICQHHMEVSLSLNWRDYLNHTTWFHIVISQQWPYGLSFFFHFFHLVFLMKLHWPVGVAGQRLISESLSGHSPVPSDVVSCWATWSQELVTTLADNYGWIYEQERMMMKSRRRMLRRFITRMLIDGYAAVRAPDVRRENTALPCCFTHVKQPTGCVAMLRPWGFGKI